MKYATCEEDYAHECTESSDSHDVIHTASSHYKIGMPFSIPYPSSCNCSMEGTTIAGGTAPTTKPKKKLHSQGKFIRKWEITVVEHDLREAWTHRQS